MAGAALGLESPKADGGQNRRPYEARDEGSARMEPQGQEHEHAGHSQGAVFALYYASRNPLDGLILVAPGGNVATAEGAQALIDAGADAVISDDDGAIAVLTRGKRGGHVGVVSGIDK